jgi:hypothetical protein
MSAFKKAGEKRECVSNSNKSEPSVKKPNIPFLEHSNLVDISDSEEENVALSQSQKSNASPQQLSSPLTESKIDEIAACERENAAMKEKYKAMENTIKKLEMDKQKRQKEIETSNKKIKDLETEIKSLQKETKTGCKWLVEQKKCDQLYQSCQGQISRFLSRYLPMLYTVPELISTTRPPHKHREVQYVLENYWKNLVTSVKEIEKATSTQRNKITQKLYKALKTCSAVVMDKNMIIYEYYWNARKEKYVPKVGNYTVKYGCKWAIPKALAKEEFIIVAETAKKTVIEKIDLHSLVTTVLCEKRIYSSKN